VLYVDGRPAVHGLMTRGLAYWTDGEQERLLLNSLSLCFLNRLPYP